jgi:murein DD-endopeptidase MepM/ murein hydrolase activator NlpD
MIPPDIKLAGPALAHNEALLIMHEAFAYRGARDTLRIHAKGTSAGAPVEVNGDIAIVTGFAKNSYIFPLRGTWYAGVGPTFHSGHRWSPMEQFGFDIAKIGAGGNTYRGDGTKFTDYYAYGADVLAAADGRVVAAEDGLAEDTNAMRRPGETLDGYMARLAGDQSTRLAGGSHAIAGNYVMIDHGNGEYALYAHLQPGSVRVKVGALVKQGQTVGKLGSSGNSTEPHLHFQVCDAADPLMCAGIPVQFSNIEIPWADGTREVQSGDMVIAK